MQQVQAVELAASIRTDIVGWLCFMFRSTDTKADTTYWDGMIPKMRRMRPINGYVFRCAILSI